MFPELNHSQTMIYQRLIEAYKQQTISHAYLFDGLQGTGKHQVALAVIQYILCEEPNTDTCMPCGRCMHCTRVFHGNHPSVIKVEREGQQIKKEQIEKVIDDLSLKGYEKGYRFYFIQEADRMNPSAANALLKFLEEPYPKVIAFLLTASYSKMLPTIQSRCQRIKFAQSDKQLLIDELKEEQQLTTSIAHTLSYVTLGKSEAMEIFEEESFHALRKSSLRFVRYLEQDSVEALLLYGKELKKWNDREEISLFFDLLLYAYRDMMNLKLNRLIPLCYPDEKETLAALALQLTYQELSIRIDAVLLAKRRLQSNVHRELLVEQLIFHIQEGFLSV